MLLRKESLYHFWEKCFPIIKNKTKLPRGKKATSVGLWIAFNQRQKKPNTSGNVVYL